MKSELRSTLSATQSGFNRNITVVLPAFNEQDGLRAVVEDIRAELPGAYILVVDNGSTDRTYKIARDIGLMPVVERTRGKGFAVRKGFKFADRDRLCEYVVMMDSDYTYPAEWVKPMLRVLESGDYHVVMGWRRYRENGAVSRVNAVGNWLLTLMANTLYGTRIHDLCTGMWVFTWPVARTMELNAPGFTLEAEMFIELRKKGYRIAEVPISYRRRAGEAKLHILDGVRIALHLLRRRFGR